MAKEQQRTVYTTARGKQIDMVKLASQNELTIAVGNANVNARGDKLGPGGKIIQRKIQQVQIPDRTPPQPAVPEVVVPEVPNIIIPKKNIKDMDPEGLE